MRLTEKKKKKGRCKSNHVNMTFNENGLHKPIKRQFVRLAWKMYAPTSALCRRHALCLKTQIG